MKAPQNAGKTRAGRSQTWRMKNNAEQCRTSLSFERIEARLTRPANSSRAALIRAATHRWRMSG